MANPYSIYESERAVYKIGKIVLGCTEPFYGIFKAYKRQRGLGGFHIIADKNGGVLCRGKRKAQEQLDALADDKGWIWCGEQKQIPIIEGGFEFPAEVLR